MSDHDLLERMQIQMDKMSDKLDEALSFLSDIRANEQITARRFDECESKYRDLEKEIEALKEDTVSKEEFKPVKQAYDWSLKILITAVVGALISMVVIQPQSFIKPESVIEKPKESQTSGQEK